MRGASSSNRMGWDKKISLKTNKKNVKKSKHDFCKNYRDLRHSPRISCSVSCTFFPGLDPRTNNKKIKISKLMNKKKHKTRISPSSNLAIILSMFSLSVSAPFPPPGPNTLLSIVHLKKLETHQDCYIEWINGDVFTIAGFRTSGLFWQPVTELQMAGLVDAAAHRWSHL